MRYCRNIVVILISMFLLQGCINLKIHRNVFSDAVLDSTDAFEGSVLEGEDDIITGFAFNPVDKKMMIMTNKYQIIAPMSEQLQFILSVDEIKDHIIPYSRNYTYPNMTLFLEYSTYTGVLHKKPILNPLVISMCFKNSLSTDDREKFKTMLENEKIIFYTYEEIKEKPCFNLELTEKGGVILPLDENFDGSFMTKLTRPIPYRFITRLPKNSTKLAIQNGIATGLSPITTVLDEVYEVGQYIALPITIWWM